MADKISATITYLDSSNNKGTKSITDIDPSASASSIKNFCEGLTALTTNTLSTIEKLEKTDITSATAKAAITLQTEPTELRWGGIVQAMEQQGAKIFFYQITTSPLPTELIGLQLSATGWQNNLSTYLGITAQIESSGKLTIALFIKGGDVHPDEDFNLEIFIPETATTQARTLTIPVTVRYE